MPKDSRVLRHIPFSGTGEIAARGGFNFSEDTVVIPTTEAMADADTFVCEMTGASNANETGVGGGLSGSDLVLTRETTTVGASTGTTGDQYRRVNTSAGFTVTVGFFNGLFRGEEYTFASRIHAVQGSASGAQYMRYLSHGFHYEYSYAETGSGTEYIVLYASHVDANGSVAMETPSVRQPLKSDGSDALPTQFPGWLITTRKRNVLISGVSFDADRGGDITLPTKISELSSIVSAVQLREVTDSAAHNGEFPNYYSDVIVGINGGTRYGSWDQGTVVVSKKALGMPKGLFDLEKVDL